MQTPNAPATDWPAIRDRYEKTPDSVRAIARWFSISDTAIRKKAKAENWARPKLGGLQPDPPADPITTPLVKAAAGDVAVIIGRGRNLVERLLDELDATSSHLGEIEAAIENETEEDRDGRRRGAMFQAVSLPTRTKVLLNLGTALTRLADAQPGKKIQAQRSAESAAPVSRFAPPAAPKLVVDNG